MKNVSLENVSLENVSLENVSLENHEILFKREKYVKMRRKLSISLENHS